MQPRGSSITAAVVPDQLQKAARELQAAIQSVRRRRESTEQPQSLPTPCYAGNVVHDESDGDKENISVLRNSDVVYTRDKTTKGMRGTPVSERWGEAGGVNVGEDESDGEDALALSQLSGLSGLSAFDSDDSDAWSTGDQQAATIVDLQQETAIKQGALTIETLEDEARRALCWMQQDVERQARANKAATESLVRAVREVSDAIADAVPGAASRLSIVKSMISAERVLVAELVTTAVAQWKLALDEWKQQRTTEKQELAQRFTAFRDECESRLQLLEVTHQSECERLQETLNRQRQESNQRECFYEDERSKICCLIQEMNTKMERLQCQSEDLTAHMLRQAEQPAARSSLSPTTAPPSELARQVPTRELLDLAALAKEADLRALQWQMAFEEQAEASSRTEARLQVLLEDQRVRDEMTKRTLERMVPRQAVEVYQERFGWLEDHVRDMQSQIACDHEQFGYEVAKWEQEKLGVRSELDEIRGVSVKLLKVLLIREKLLKKREHKHASRLESIEHKLEASKGALKHLVQTLMQESAALLLVLQQLVVQAVAVPIKPAHVRAMIKQLKRLDRTLDKVKVASTAEVATDEATLSFSMDSAMSEASFDVGGAESPCGGRVRNCEEKQHATEG